MSKPLLAIAIPVLNKNASIKKITTGWLSLIDGFFAADEDVKLVLVDYGSTDGTVEVLKEIQNQYPNQVTIEVGSAAGYNNGLITAYNKAVSLKPEYVFQVNGDDLYSPDEFHVLWERHQISKLAIGFRKNSKEASVRYKWIIKLLYGVTIKDVSIPYRLYKASYLKHLLSLLPQKLPVNPNTYFSILAKYSGEGLHNVPIEYKGNGATEENAPSLSDIMSYKGDVKRKSQELLKLLGQS